MTLYITALFVKNLSYKKKKYIINKKNKIEGKFSVVTSMHILSDINRAICCTSITAEKQKHVVRRVGK